MINYVIKEVYEDMLVYKGHLLIGGKLSFFNRAYNTYGLNVYLLSHCSNTSDEFYLKYGIFK